MLNTTSLFLLFSILMSFQSKMMSANLEYLSKKANLEKNSSVLHEWLLEKITSSEMKLMSLSQLFLLKPILHHTILYQTALTCALFATIPMALTFAGGCKLHMVYKKEPHLPSHHTFDLFHLNSIACHWEMKNLLNLESSSHFLWTCQIFENNFEIEQRFTYFFKESCGLDSDQHFSIKYFLWNILVKKIKPKKSGQFWALQVWNS